MPKKTTSEHAKIIQTYAKNNHLEIIFSEGHHLYDKIFYDSPAGQYYNRETDLFLSESELGAFGLGPSKPTVLNNGGFNYSPYQIK